MAAYGEQPKDMSRAKDADPEAVARGLAAMLLKLKEQLGTEDFRALCERVCGEEADEPEAEAEDDDPSTEFASPAEREMADKAAKDKRAKDRKAMDDPEPFKGEPETKAMDAAADPRFAFVADALRVKPGQPGAAYGDVSSKVRRAPSTASAERSFGEMFGAAALDIKVR